MSSIDDNDRQLLSQLEKTLMPNGEHIKSHAFTTNSHFSYGVRSDARRHISRNFRRGHNKTLKMSIVSIYFWIDRFVLSFMSVWWVVYSKLKKTLFSDANHTHLLWKFSSHEFIILFSFKLLIDEQIAHDLPINFATFSFNHVWPSRMHCEHSHSLQFNLQINMYQYSNHCVRFFFCARLKQLIQLTN